jgi:hypothetical protein
MLQFAPDGQNCVEFRSMWKFAGVPFVKFGWFW